MEIEHLDIPESKQSEHESKRESHPFTLVPSVQLVPLAKSSVVALQHTENKSDGKGRSDQILDEEVETFPGHQNVFDCEGMSSDALTADHYNISIAKRARGRPRKNARATQQLQHRAMFRGRGRPKRDDCDSKVLRPKIFPGRPGRVRTRKINRLSSFLPSAHSSNLHLMKDDIEVICDSRDHLESSETNTDNATSSTETSPKSSNLTYSKKKCSLCNLSDSSCLGQGKLKEFKPTPGFTPSICSVDTLKIQVKQVETDEVLEKKLASGYISLRTTTEVVRRRHRSAQGPKEKSYVSQNPLTELLNIGFDPPPEIQQVFQISGETDVHINCAIWSEGVIKLKGDYSNVDKAVLNGMFQNCIRCGKYGASVKCNIFDCDKVYHYPCAILSGALQNIKNFKIVCKAHLDRVADFEGECVACKHSHPLTDILTCSLCLKYYHTNCLIPRVDPKSIVRAGWQCFECKTCQTCRKPGDENKILVCESCDKGYHIFCLKPVLTTVPKSGWKCHGCRICGDCGARTPGSGPSSRWHLNYTVCDSCYQQRNKGVACPLCGKAYRQFSRRKEMRHCCVCRKYIHVECDNRPDQSVNPLEYVCPICINPVEIVDRPTRQTTEVSPRRHSVDPSRSPPEVLLSSSRDSFTTENDNSFSSAESDSAPESVVGKLAVKKRAKTADLRRRKKGSKSKIKSFSMPGVMCISSFQVEPKEYKTEDDDPSADNRMVLVSASDEFVLCQDLCVMCGSFGKGEEGRLIACAQCGQCYHSYCASIKVTSVVLKKGWRCLDCTVCEGCGQPHDEARLLLCDECDISFHIYCLDPPLKEVPPGNWKCKWCVVCIKCGSRSPGINCNWQSNYTLCGPCSSAAVCSVCTVNYEENDLIIQCSQCQRWCHGKCDQIESEENAEKCADFGYICILCRPSDEPPPHLLPPPSPPTPEPEPVIEIPPSPIPKLIEQDIIIKVKPVAQFLADGVSLTESGMRHIKSLALEIPKKISKPRKSRFSSLVSSSHPYSTIPSYHSSDSLDVGNQMLQESFGDRCEYDSKLEIDVEQRGISVDNQKELFIDDSDKKKKPRKLQKLGIGGFVVKPRGRGSFTRDVGNEHADSPSESNQTPTSETAHMVCSESSDTLMLEKPKRRRKPKKKTPLDESFPPYLRDAFFGKDLLISCKKVSNTWDPTLQDDSTLDDNSNNFCKSSTVKDQPVNLPSRIDFSGDASVRSKTSDHDSSTTTSQSVAEQKPTPPVSSFTISQENLLSILNRNNDNDDDQGTAQVVVKEERDSQFSSSCSNDIPPFSDGTGFPQIDSKDVEDVIEGALRDQASSQVPSRIKDSRMSGFLSDASNSPIHVSQHQSSSPFSVQRPAHTQSSPIHRENTPSLQHQDSNSSWSESESSDQTQMQKNTMKWETDEPLGLLSTISPVLYANINCPQLKVDYPNWPDRVKQIAKIWRNLPSEKRQPYLQKARENRANSRTQKTTSDLDRCSKETKTQELDPEKQWKQLQTLRQLQHQKQQKIIEEKRAQGPQKTLMKAHVDKQESGPSEIDSSLKQNPSLTDLNQALRVDHEADSVAKENALEKMYGTKWGPGSTPPKLEETNVLQHAQPNQDKEVICPQQCRPALAGSFIHVSRIRTPIDPNRLPVGDSMAIQGAQSNLPTTDHYPPSPSILSPRGVPHPLNRMPFATTSPVTRQSLLIPRSEISRTPTTPTMQKEILYTPPPTPRPQSSDSFFQGSVSPRAQFLSPVESQSLTHKATAVAQFNAGMVDSNVYRLPQNVNQYSVELTSLSGTLNDASSSKTFYTQSPIASSNNKSNQLQIQPSQIRLEELSKNKTQQSSILQPEHFVQQTQATTSIPQNMAKVLQYKDDIYGSMPSTPRPLMSAQECVAPHQTFEHMLKENPDPNKLMAHHQLRELLQKQQLGNQEDLILQFRGKEAAHLQQWRVYNTATLQFMSKDDCFRQPFPPTVRTRNLSAKDIKSEMSPDVLSGGNLKLDLLTADDANKAEKMIQGNVTVVSGNLPTSQDSDSINEICSSVQQQQPMKKEADSLQMIDSAAKRAAPNFGKDNNKSNLQDVSDALLHKDNTEQSALTMEAKDDLCNQGAGKKRKTTAGDLVKDLEAHPEENDAITSSCTLDALTADGELELDDDELLGLGNDFNILEYADPELDKGLVGEGEKSNILDEHLDLDDKDELEDEEEEMKSQAVSSEKEINTVVHSENKNFPVDRHKVNVSQKHKASDLPSDYLTEKKDDKEFKTEFKDIECDQLQKTSQENSELVKKEAKTTFSSCSLSNVSFCASDDLSLKAEMPKDVHVSPQSSMSFGSAIQNLSPQDPVPAYSTQIVPPQYRLGNIVRQNLSPSNTQVRQPSIIPQQRNIFPLHVGLPLRQSVPVLQPSVVTNQSQQQNRPLLLQEQPLLLEDLVEQEKREQLRQSQEGLISPQGDALLSDIDFERLKDDVFSGPPDDSLGGPGSLLGGHESLKTLISPSQSNTSVSSQNYVPPPYSLIWQNQEHAVPCTGPPRAPTVMQNVQRPQVSNVIMPSGMVLHGEPSLRPVQPQKSPVAGPFGANFVPTPPSPPVMDPHTEQEKQKLVQYEKFLLQQQTVLTTQQKYFETEVIKLRKLKKALNAKQRALRKNGSELSENDAIELAKVSQEQATLQKQLDQVRKQSRQHTIALQDYRMKQQKRPQQQIPQSPVHASISSLQSSPQSSLSPHQMVQTAPQSPLLPSSPMGPSPSCVQHSPSPLMQHSPAAASPTVVGQPPLVHSHIISQQIHFQVPRPEGKAWCNPVQMTQLTENIQHSDRFLVKEGSETLGTAQLPVKQESKDLPKADQETVLKRIADNAETTTIIPKVEDQNAALKPSKLELGLESDSAVDAGRIEDANVSNRGIDCDNLGVRADVAEKDTTAISMDRQSDKNCDALSSSKNEPMVFNFDVALASQMKPGNTSENIQNVTEGEAIKDNVNAQIVSSGNEQYFASKKDSASQSTVENVEMKPLHIPSESPMQSLQNKQSTAREEIELEMHIIRDNQVSVDTPRTEDGDEKEKFASSLLSDNKNNNNEASSDEELESLSRKASSNEGDQFLGKQNVLLKQLLQNCPSAEAPHTPEDNPENRKDDGGNNDSIEIGKRKLEEAKLKKPSYLDIRRAQLEKEPTPPPGEAKIKGAKRKRPKKKKADSKDGSPVKKKCRKALLAKDESFGAPLENIVTQLTSLPPSRILEPNIKPNFNTLSVFGSGDLNARGNQLKGSYGNAALPNQSDVYAYYPYGKEHAAPILALPPSPPYRGFYNQEFPQISKGKVDISFATAHELEQQNGIRDCDSPDTVVSSSSPECVFEPVPKCPKIVFIDTLDPESDHIKSYSPDVPLITPIPIRFGSYSNELSRLADLDKEKDKENIPRSELKSEISLLKSKFSSLGGYSTPLKDAGNVSVTLTLSAAAADDISGVLSRLADFLKIPIPPTYEIVERTATPPSQKLGLYPKTDMNIHSLLNGKPRFCRHCDIVVLSAGIRKKACDLTCITKEEQEEEEDEVIFCSTNCYMQFALTHRSSSSTLQTKEIQSQKWKSVKYKYFTSFAPLQASKPGKLSKEEQGEKATKPFYQTIKVNPMPRDMRKCIFCHVVGDGDANGAARLLNMDVDKWVHLNCALWSAEVYETVNGALVNVEVAFKRAVLLVCSACHKPGASLKCFKIRCTTIYHFTCAMKEHCVFFKDKTLLCSHHANKGNSENELESVVVNRRVYIDRDEHKQVASMIQTDQYVMRVGSLIFMNIGQLLPQQMQAFHTPNCIYPVGYKIVRMYWSMRKLGKRCLYICSISEVNGKPEFQILVKESDHKDIVLKDKTSKALWQKVIYPIEKMRKQAKTIKIFPDFITGDDLFGLTEPAVLRIVESLPGVDTLMDYNFRYGRSPFLELPLAINPTGCARSEPKLRTHVKRSHTLHTSNSSRASFHTTFAGMESSSPYIKQFVHSKSSQYRKMKTEWRNNVFLARSRIQGLGLYAARDIEKHTMVIEYIGQIIRNEIAERNECVYNEQNRGVYMFRLDENRVIDATLSGGLARYINHSCNPNCVAENVQIDRENKILIIANRRITRGEELSYDYKFEVEDDQHKIPCLCRAPNCRKWMN